MSVMLHGRWEGILLWGGIILAVIIILVSNIYVCDLKLNVTSQYCICKCSQ